MQAASIPEERRRGGSKQKHGSGVFLSQPKPPASPSGPEAKSQPPSLIQGITKTVGYTDATQYIHISHRQVNFFEKAQVYIKRSYSAPFRFIGQANRIAQPFTAVP